MPQRIARVLGAQLLDHRALTGGVSASVQALDLRTGEGHCETVVLRTFPDDPPDEARRRIQQEAALLRHGRAAGLPVPRLIWEDGEGAVLGTPAVVMELLPGSTELHESDLPVAIPRIAQLLDQVHQTPPPPDADLPLRLDPLPQLRGWLGELGETGALERLEGSALPPLPGRPCLLHGDVWPGNLLWENGVLVGLIDWEDAALGDPHSDLAGARSELAVAFGPGAAEALLAASPEAVDPVRLRAWDLYVAAASLVYMDRWGLPADVLAARRIATRRFFEARLAEG